jgi:primary-amine oxidase
MMSTQTVSGASAPQVPAAKQVAFHPLDPLTAIEIETTAQLIQSLYPEKIDLRFKVITLKEPEKKAVVPYLEAEHSGGKLPNIDRRAFVSYYIRNTVCLLPLILFRDT